MCSIIGSSKKINKLSDVNRFSKNRGPDNTSEYEYQGLHLIHNLLSITGSFTKQPFISDCGNILCLYNGEIYNYKKLNPSSNSDGECIIPLYKEHGETFARLLDGEFAIALIDLSLNKIILNTDTFATKPLWWIHDGNDFAFASYESCLLNMEIKGQPQKVAPNTIQVYDLESLNLINEHTVTTFNLDQYKDSFEDWEAAFLNSVKKRSLNEREGVFIGLSGGYDSGAIALALNIINAEYKAYCTPGAENRDTIQKRKSLVKDFMLLDITPEEFLDEKRFLAANCEDFKTKGKSTARNDKASAGLSFVCRHARNHDCKIYLSGQGADEIISDYGANGKAIFSQSQLAGRFPNDLNKVFPWNNFYRGVQQKYLGKEECVSGAHGVEGRYPFLDIKVVQEFLNLTAGRKNSKYKAPIDFFLRKHNFPFIENEKKGFRPNHYFRHINKI